ncbi:MAG: DEAD/DEAH box helicase [Candidatus Omnitrophota bacterium]|nr:DEAD/DEAH box helicase [Candidatus Omnitrophota bacterium]
MMKIIAIIICIVVAAENSGYCQLEDRCLRAPLLFRDYKETQSRQILFPSKFLPANIDDICLVYNNEELSGVSLEMGNAAKVSFRDSIGQEDVNIDYTNTQVTCKEKKPIKGREFLSQFVNAYPSKKKILIVLDEKSFKDKNNHPVLPYLYLIPHMFQCVRTAENARFYFYMVDANDLSELKTSAVKTYLSNRGGTAEISDMQIYRDAVLDGSELIAGILIPQTRTKGVSSMILKKYPDFVVLNCAVGRETGAFQLGGKKNVIFQGRKDLIGKPLLAIRSHGSWSKVIDQKTMSEVYARPDEKSPDAIFVGGEFKGVLPRYGADKELQRYSNPRVRNVLLNKEGGLFALGRLFFKQRKGYENHAGATIVCNEKGEPVRVYGSDGNLLWYDPQTMDELKARTVYVGAEFKNGKIEGGEIVYASDYGIPSKVLDKYPDCIITNIDIRGESGVIEIGNRRICERPGLKGTKGYAAVQQNGRIVYIYDRQGSLIYSNTDKDRNALFIGWSFENGKLTWSNFSCAFEKEVPNSMIRVLPNCAISNVKADISGTVQVAHKTVVQSKPELIGRSDLAVIFYNSEPIAVCGPDGVILYIVNERGLSEAELEQAGLEIDEGILISIVRNFGIVHAFNIVKRLLNVREATAARIMASYLDILSDEEKAGYKGSMEDAGEFFQAARSIFSQLNPDRLNKGWLSDVLIKYMYRFAAADMAGFLSNLDREVNNKENPEALRSAYQKVYGYYKKTERMRTAAAIKKKLFLFQRMGVDFILEHKRAILADECGLGKTIQAIASALSCRENGAEKVLIISPKSAMDWWREEVVSSTDIEKMDIFLWGENKDISEIGRRRFVIVNYEAIRGRDNKLRDYLKSAGFDFIIVDEAHRMRNESLQTRAILEFDAEYKLLLSATPLVGSKTRKLYYLMHWLYPELFPSLGEFSKNYSDNPFALRDILSNFMLARTMADVKIDIPEREMRDISVNLSGRQKEVYERYRDRFKEWFIASGNWFNRGMVFTKLEKLRQAAISPALVDKREFTPAEGLKESAKYQKVLKIAESELQQGRKIIIFTRYLEVVDNLKKLLGAEYPGRVVCLTGRDNAKKRHKTIWELTVKKDVSILVATYGAAGQSLNIQAASTVIFIDYPWTYQEFMQAMDRVYRIGQTEVTKIYRLIASDTIDEHILKILKRSEDLHRFIVIAGEALGDYDRDMMVTFLAREFEIPGGIIKQADDMRSFVLRKPSSLVAPEQPQYVRVGEVKIDSAIAKKIILTLSEIDVLNALKEGEAKYKVLSIEEINVIKDVMNGLGEQELIKKYSGRWMSVIKSAMMKSGAKTVEELPSSYKGYLAALSTAQANVQKSGKDSRRKTLKSKLPEAADRHDLLRPEMAFGKGILKRSAILPLQASLYKTDFSRVVITDPEQIKQMIEKVHRDKLEGGYEPGSIVERVYSLDAINITNCFVFEALRLRVICFEANSDLAKILGYAHSEDRDYDQKFFDKTYTFSIENEKQEIVGHGILAYNSDMPGTALFRYSIHGSVHIAAYTHDFSGKGYGVEALLLMMIIAKRGEVFPKDINKLEYLLLEEDYSNSFGYLRTEPNEDFYNMRDFLLRAGFVDETQFDLGRKHLPKDPVILYYMSKPQPMDIEKLAQLVLNRLVKQDRKYGDSFLKIFTFTDIADIKGYAYPMALEAGMAIPEDMDWQALANLIWHKYRGENSESEPFYINGVYFGKDLQRKRHDLLRPEMAFGKNRMRGQNLSAEEVFRKIYISKKDDDLGVYLIARMIDKLGIGENDNIVSVGQGVLSYHLIACAVRGAKVDIVQPKRYKRVAQTKDLEKAISSDRKEIKRLCGKDLVGGRINTKSYQSYVEKVNLPQKRYSYAFLFEVYDIIEGEYNKKMFARAVLSSLKDNATIIMSVDTPSGQFLESSIKAHFGIFKKHAKELDYTITEGREFHGNYYELIVVRNPKVEIPPKSPAGQAL